MAEIIKSAIVPYTSEQMLNLVNQVESYPEFLQWCEKGFLKETFKNGYVAGMLIKISGVEVEFATRNTIEIDGDYINLMMSLEKARSKNYPDNGSSISFRRLVQKLSCNYNMKSNLRY